MRSMSSLDICAVLYEIKESLIGGFLINIYNVHKKIYILKVSNNDSKHFLLLEAGNRIHLTGYMQYTDSLPSGFTMKLRKHLKGKKINEIKQVNMDRVVDILFGSGEHSFHLIIQFYVSGNIFLTDHEYKIIISLRQHVPELKQANANVYPIPTATSNSYLKEGVELSLGGIRKHLTAEKTLSAELKSLMPFLIAANLKQLIPNNKDITEDNIDESAQFLYETALKVVKLIERFNNEKVSGYVITQSVFTPNGTDIEIPATALLDYSPLDIPKESSNYILFPSYNECLDFYFGKFETFEKPSKKPSKAEKIKIDQERRIVNMKGLIETATKNVDLLDANAGVVEECITLIRNLSATGSKWEDIWNEIELNKEKGHKIALLIDKVDFKKSLVHIKLKGSADDKYHVVPISISKSVFGNVREMHNTRKNLLAKIERTSTSMAAAIKNASNKEKKAENNKNAKVKRINRIKMRKRFWFEKFKWFISSDDYLVLAGRDLIQNELLVKRYMETNDIYIHADIHGATSCIVKNNSPQPVPNRTLIEAGQFSVCNSSAWKSKFMTSAWWVNSNQVSKTPETGEYVPAGSFVIRGKKNFLPPSKLEMGLAILYLDKEPAEILTEGPTWGPPVAPEGANEATGETEKEIKPQTPEQTTNHNKKEFKPLMVETKKSSKAPVRGKKFKNKKMKNYKDQDSDVEEIRMMLMGSKPVKEKATSEQTVQTTRSERTAKKVTISDRPIIKSPHFNAALISKESYEVNEDQEETEKPNGISGETPFLCVGMCGPWEAISRYKLKIKLIPGASKKSDIAKQALSKFASLEKDTSRKELISSLVIDELSLVILENCKSSI